MSPQRIFHPPFGFDYRTSVTDSSGIQWLAGHQQTILINIHGRMSEKGLGEPRAAYGNHFGDSSRHNESGLKPRETLELSNLYEGAADLYATLRAVRAVKEYALGTEIKLVVLRNCSPWLGEYMNQMVWVWEKTGYKNSTGRLRVNASLIQQLHEALLSLESMGTAVKFWGVSRQVTGILKARKLCNLVLMAKPGVEKEALDFLEHSSSSDEMDID